MRKKLLKGLLVLNILLATAILAGPLLSQVLPRGLWNCCKSEVIESGEYCCMQCCWLVKNCDDDLDCVMGPGG